MQWAEKHVRKNVCSLDLKLASPTNTQIQSKVSPKLEGQKIRSCREVNEGQSVFLFFEEADVTRRRTGIIMIAESSKRVEKRIR